MEMKLSRKRILLYLTVILLLIGLIFLLVYIKGVLDYRKAVNEIAFDNIKISDVADGIYFGECDVNFIYAKVEVTVESGEIISIDILDHKNGRGKSAESVIDEIVNEQKIDVDAVAGATNSSKVIKKAVENAISEHK